jgi:hypothetical protein
MDSVPPIIIMALHEMSIRNNILSTFRVSFGFANTTALMIGSYQIRLNPGLESPEQMIHYKNFLIDLQEMVDEVLLENFSDDEYKEESLCEKIQEKWNVTNMYF